MDDKIERIENKLDKISKDIGQINTTLAAQHVSLKDHIRRTTLLEKQMEPIKTHVDMVSGALKILILAAALAAIAEAIGVWIKK